MTRRIISLIFAVLMSFTTNAAANSTPPLPVNIVVVPALPSVSQNLARFSGVWVDGNWDGHMGTALVVEQVESDTSISVIYAHGTSDAWGINQGQWYRRSATYDKDRGQLLVSFGDGASVSYWFNQNGTLGALYTKPVQGDVVISRTMLRKHDPWGKNAPLLPADLRIQSPNNTVTGAARFVGMWHGSWGKVLSHTLVVESVDGDVAQVIFSSGVSPHWNRFKPVWNRLTATYDPSKDTLLVKFPSGNTAEYSFASNDALRAEWHFRARGTRAFGHFTRHSELTGKAAD